MQQPNWNACETGTCTITFKKKNNNFDIQKDLMAVTAKKPKNSFLVRREKLIIYLSSERLNISTG